MRITLVNALAEPTIAHWHGLTVDTRNDGNGSFLVPPGERYDYDFEVRNRAGMYWYHPHPHGRSAPQTYRGLYGLILVEDDDERALRTALDVAPGATEIPLVLQDRRAGVDYAPTPADLTHGFLGDEAVRQRHALPVSRRRDAPLPVPHPQRCQCPDAVCSRSGPWTGRRFRSR